MDSKEPSPPTTQNLKHKSIFDRKFSRRDLLKGAGALTGACALSGVDAFFKAKNIIDTFGRLEKAALTVRFQDEVPPTLKNVDMPKRNEHLREPPKIVQEAFDYYNQWLKNNSSLPGLYWKKPVNFLEYKDLVPDLIQKVSTDTAPSEPSRYIDTVWTTVLSTLLKNDRPYSSFIRFSGQDIHSVKSLITYDPGSGIVANAFSRFKEYKRDPNYDLYTQITNNNFSDQDEALLIEEIKKTVNDSTTYIINQGKGKPVSTSVLLAYFLHQNKGDISQSLWDTTIVLKLLSRNDRDTLEFKPARANADQVNSLFLDEFSPNISFNWLCDNIPPSNKELNDTKEEKYKNYQPINSIGNLYHGWNTISWLTCIQPELAPNLLRAYFGFNLLDVRPEQGSDKIRSDLRVASSLGEVYKLIESYEKK